jgi:hypothetical protein
MICNSVKINMIKMSLANYLPLKTLNGEKIIKIACFFIFKYFFIVTYKFTKIFNK